MTVCCDIRGCPGSQYINCAAYKTGKNCWEVLDVPCCKRNDKGRCKECSIYLKAMGKGGDSKDGNSSSN